MSGVTRPDLTNLKARMLTGQLASQVSNKRTMVLASLASLMNRSRPLGLLTMTGLKILRKENLIKTRQKMKPSSLRKCSKNLKIWILGLLMNKFNKILVLNKKLKSISQKNKELKSTSLALNRNLKKIARVIMHTL